MKVFWQRFIFIVFSALVVIVILYYYQKDFEENAKDEGETIFENEGYVENVESEPLVVFVPENEKPKSVKTYLGKFVLTAYCPCEICCGEYGKNRPVDKNGKVIVYGSIGERLNQGFSVAVDPSVIPYGSKVEIDGHVYTAQDCGGAIKENRIDVYFDNHEEALEFGIREKGVYLIEGGGE